MGINHQQKVVVKELDDKVPAELFMSDVHTEGLANSVSSFLDHSIQKFDLDDRFAEILRAIPERLTWLNRRVKAYELDRDMSMVSNARVRQGAKLINDNIEVIGALLPVIHPEHGEEPNPYVQTMMGGGIRRFVNLDWTEWYSLFNQVTTHGLFHAAADRTVDRLFPTVASKESLCWTVSQNLIIDERTGAVTYPHEIVITRNVQVRV